MSEMYYLKVPVSGMDFECRSITEDEAEALMMYDDCIIDHYGFMRIVEEDKERAYVKCCRDINELIGSIGTLMNVESYHYSQYSRILLMKLNVFEVTEKGFPPIDIYKMQ